MDVMYVCKNKSSGKYFICVDEQEDGSALLITPLGDIKTLDLTLFQDHEVLASSYLLNSNLIDRKQLERYQAFRKNSEQIQ